MLCFVVIYSDIVFLKTRDQSVKECGQSASDENALAAMSSV